MKDHLVLLGHLLTTVAKLLGPGGAKIIVADSLLMKQQLLVLNRSRRRAPNLSALDRFLLGFWSLFLNPRHIQRAAVIIRPSTLLKFHDLLKKRKYRLLYSSECKRKPGPKGPSRELIQAIVALKQRNPRFGCRRIAQQINKAFDTDIDKDIVRRVLANHYRPAPGGSGPSWLTFLGHTKDSLWSVDLFCCESILLKSHWVLVVMDQFTRRIIGLGVHAGDVDGIALCRMFNAAISTKGVPKYLSSDNDPLFLYHQWQANLRVLSADESRQFRICLYRTPLLNGLSELFAENFLIRRSSGMLRILRENWKSFGNITTQNGCTIFRWRYTSGAYGESCISARNSQPLWKSHCNGLFHTQCCLNRNSPRHAPASTEK